MMRSRNKIHLSANIIIRLMYELSKLIIIMGRYLGIYAKDSLDELLLTTHHNSSYGGRSREVERRAVNYYIDELNDEIEWRDDFPYENVVEITDDIDDTKWDERSEPNGDNFPYINHMKTTY